MAGDEPSTNNVFVRFKNNVDDHIKRGVETFTGPHNPGSMSEHPRNEMSSASQSPQPPQLPQQHHRTSGTSGSDQGLASAEDVYKWAESSPYSPFNLQHLPQPRPRGAPEGWEDSFTFREAFEDLLTVSSERPLPRFGMLAAFNIRSTFVDGGGGLPLSTWVSDLGSRGLWDAYFPLSSWDRRVLSAPISDVYPGDRRFHICRGIFDPIRIARLPWSNTEASWSPPLMGLLEFDKRATKAAMEKQARPGDADTEEDLYNRMESSYADLVEKLKQLRRMFFEDLDEDPDRLRKNSGTVYDPSGIQSDVPSIMNITADILEAVFPPRQGDFNNKNNNSNTHDDNTPKARHITTLPEPDLRPPMEPVSPRFSSPDTVTTEIPTLGGGLVQVTVERQPLRDGQERVTTTRRVLDADQNVVSSSRYTTTSYTRTWSTAGAVPGLDASFSWNWNKTARRDYDDGDDDDDDADDRNEEENGNGEGGRRGKRSGWFWTK